MVRDLNGTAGTPTAPAVPAAPPVIEPLPDGAAAGSGTHSAPAARDMCQLTGTGRIALPPKKLTSANDNEYVVLRVAQNVKIVNQRLTNWFDLLCFGARATIAQGLAVGQEIPFVGSFAQVEYMRRDGTKASGLKVNVDYLRPGPMPASRD